MNKPITPNNQSSPNPVTDRVTKPASAPPKRSIFAVFADVRESSTLFFIVILIVLVGLRSGHAFLNPENFRDILLDISILAIVAIGQMLMLVTRSIDLSIGSLIGLSAMAIGMFVSAHWGLPPIVAVLMGIGVGILCGAFNGLVVTIGKVPPLITTLGTLSIFRGLVYLVGQGLWVDANELPASFKQFTIATFLGIPALVYFAIAIALIFFYVLNYTRFGRQIYAIGSNPLAAQFAGIRVNRIIFTVYVLSGALAGLSGVFWVSRYANAANNTAAGWELQAVAACVIGGVSFAGGVGTLPGLMLGAFVLGIINNAVNLVGISPFWKQVMYGIIILAAVISDSLIAQRLQRALRLRRATS